MISLASRAWRPEDREDFTDMDGPDAIVRYTLVMLSWAALLFLISIFIVGPLQAQDCGSFPLPPCSPTPGGPTATVTKTPTFGASPTRTRTPAPVRTPTRTPTRRLNTSTPTRTRTPGGPTRTPTPSGGGSICPMPCDQYAFDFSYDGHTFHMDLVGPYPPPDSVLKSWPRPQDWHGPGQYTLGYAVHTPLGGWSSAQVITIQANAPPLFYSDWDEELYNELITGGCSGDPLAFCPTQFVTRQQMAVFLLKVKHGSGYLPPPCTGIFVDVPCPTPTPTVHP